MKTKSDGIPLVKDELILSAQTLRHRHDLKKKGSASLLDLQIKIDDDVYRWLKKSGPSYPKRVNKILRDIMELAPR